MMSIGVLEAMRSCRRALFYYKPINKNEIQQIIPPGIAQGIQHQVSLREYCTAYGVEVTRWDTPRYPMTLNRHFAENFIREGHRLNAEQFNALRDYAEQERKKKRPLDLRLNHPLGLRQYLQNIQWPLEDEDFLSLDDINHITGRWLEEWVYQLVQQALNLDETRIAWSFSTRYLAENEFDVVYLNRQNDLNLIECKSFLDKDGASRAMTKLSSLQKRFGIRPKLWLCVGDLDVKNLDNLELRAKELGVRILKGEELFDAQHFLN